MAGLADYEVTDFEGHRVYRRGEEEGPAVLVLHEMPSLHEGVVAFADRLVDRGYRAYLPSLFGRDGEQATGGLPTPLRMGRALAQACLSRQFHMLRERTSPAVLWLRRLARLASLESGGGGVGVVGMCITGGFALAMAMEEAVLAPVLSQPSLPWAVLGRGAGLGIDSTDLAAVKRRASNGLDVLGLRFSNDWLCPQARFERLHAELGSHFESITIDSAPDNRLGIRGSAHAVLTVDLIDQEGQPTRAALARVLTFLDERLRGNRVPTQ